MRVANAKCLLAGGLLYSKQLIARGNLDFIITSSFFVFSHLLKMSSTILFYKVQVDVVTYEGEEIEKRGHCRKMMDSLCK